MGIATVSYIIREVCEAIYNKLGPQYLSVPSNSAGWLSIAEEFQSKWQFPNCLDAIYGKHINISPAANSGSYYYNYKHSHSVVHLAAAGPNYQCLYADIGTNGRTADGGIWKKTSLLKSIEKEELGVPSPTPLLLGVDPIPLVEN